MAIDDISRNRRQGLELAFRGRTEGGNNMMNMLPVFMRLKEMQDKKKPEDQEAEGGDLLAKASGLAPAIGGNPSMVAAGLEPPAGYGIGGGPFNPFGFSPEEYRKKYKLGM